MEQTVAMQRFVTCSLVLRKATVGSASGLPRFITQMSLTMNFLKISAFASANVSVTGFTVNSHFAAG